jgi:GTP cyclohydrolase II
MEYSNKAILPTDHGAFNVISFKEEGKCEEHFLLYMGELNGKENVLTRVHSECLTGDVFGSQKCDCGEQLAISMNMIAERKEGVIVYLRQEGRGIGLFNKINAYALQDQGQDTIQANHSLGFSTDLRDFSGAVEALQQLGVQSIQLLTNNPEKLKVWENSGIKVTERVPLLTQVNEFNEGYLSVKKNKLEHYL